MSPNCLAAPGDCSGINRQRMASLQCKPLWCQFCYSPQRESKMARRRLLTGDERRRLFDPPVQETAIIGHYTLSAEDVELVGRRYRSEEHTSELQSLMRISYAVFCLQKKKQT